MVLLTSSQVSVAISSAIVVSFTTALFLSGYAIQQRTVRHLRAAIRPDTSPQIFLPDRFHDDTTELEDGTLVMLDEYNRPIRLKAGRVSIGTSDSFNVADGAHRLEAEAEAKQSSQGQGLDLDLGEVEITVEETLPPPPPSQDTDQQQQQEQQQKILALEEPSSVAQEASSPEAEENAEASRSSEGQPQEQSEPSQAQTQLAPWEIRGDDIAGDEGPAENLDSDGAKPMSRAERRRKIKEDIQKLSQGETPLYYQRRLW